MGHTVALTYNVKRSLPGAPADLESEFDSPKTIEAIAGALRSGGHAVRLVEADEHLPAWFLTHHVDLVFNIAEGMSGGYRESQVPAVLEALGIPFTGSSSLTLALALNKARTKQLLASEGLPTPAWQLFASPDEFLHRRLAFPLIVKPNCEGSAKGIGRESVVRDEAALRRQVAGVIARYTQTALVEAFIEGTELTVGVLGNEDPQVLPILEVDFSGCASSGESFYSWRMKEYQGNVELGLNPAFHCPARLDPEIAERVQEVALRAHQALGCRELSRTDIRLRSDSTPFILEVNPLPGMDPTESNFPIMTHAAGLAYVDLINRLVELAVARGRQSAQTQEPSASLSIPVPVGHPQGELVASRMAP